MNRKMIILIGFCILFFSPHLGFADCTELGNMNRWVVKEDGSVIFYSGNVSLATVTLQDCNVSSSSNISLLKSSVCDGDDILVDGQRCTILTLNVGE
jgi:hypothetical protein